MARPRTIPEPPLASREVAVLLDLSPDEVNELARRGELPAFKQGRFWRFRRADVLQHQALAPSRLASLTAAPLARVKTDPLAA